jgi:hypothetical protein
MPQGKLKVKARLPPKVQKKEKSTDPLHKTRKMAPKKAKLKTEVARKMNVVEKGIRANIEETMRSRAIQEGRPGTSSSTSAGGSGGGKPRTKKDILNKLK